MPRLNIDCSTSVRDQPQPLDRDPLAGQGHDAAQDDHRGDEILGLRQRHGDGEARPGELQRPHQAELAADRLDGGRDHILGVREDEQPDAQIANEIVRSAPGVQDYPEDQEIDGRVHQRCEHLPQPTEPRLAERGDGPPIGVRRDELPVPPDLAEVGAERRPRAGRRQPVPRGEPGQGRRRFGR
jgi:hypothetical protein